MLREGNDWLVMNPSIFAEVASHMWIGFKLGIIEIYFNIDALGYKVTPVDYQSMWNLSQPNMYCHTMGLIQELLDIELKLETYVNECIFGPLGFINNPEDPLDCWKRRYYPNLPIWKINGIPEYDLLMEFYEFECTAELEQAADLDALEPSNVSEETNSGAGECVDEDCDQFWDEEPNNLPEEHVSSNFDSKLDAFTNEDMGDFGELPV